MDYQVDTEKLEQAEAMEEYQKENGTWETKRTTPPPPAPTDENGNEIELPF